MFLLSFVFCYNCFTLTRFHLVFVLVYVSLSLSLLFSFCFLLLLLLLLSLFFFDSFIPVGFSGAASVRDLWAHKDLGTFSTSFLSSVGAQGITFLKVTPQ
jgi:hypothetical protein